MKHPQFLVTLFLLTFISGCNNAYLDEIERGTNYHYIPGYPELRMTAAGLIAEDNSTHIVVSGDVVYGSLVYASDGDIFEASFSIEIEINDAISNSLVNAIHFQKTLSSTDKAIVNSQSVYSFEKSAVVPAGSYTIIATITDLKSGKQSYIKSTTTIPDTDKAENHLTEIRILAKYNDENPESFAPVTTYDVPMRFDSLQFIFQVTNHVSENPFKLEFRLLKFRADSSMANFLHANTPQQSSLPYRGIDYSKYEVVQSSSRELYQSGNVSVEMTFGELPRGNYRFEVNAVSEEGNALYKGRDFGIKSPNYPSLRSAVELARPLYYLMDRKEYNEILSTKDELELKNAIDRFWLSNTSNKTVARQVISLYYQRVEEANKLFSNFKEGWKTDMGMIYILFGPPINIEDYPDYSIWSYSHNRDDPEKNFVFRKPYMRTNHFPFNHYILSRSSFYFDLYYNQVEKWKSGRILSAAR